MTMSTFGEFFKVTTSVLLLLQFSPMIGGLI